MSWYLPRGVRTDAGSSAGLRGCGARFFFWQDEAVIELAWHLTALGADGVRKQEVYAARGVSQVV